MKAAMKSTYPMTVFYDAACPVCSLEIDHLRERCIDGRLVFIDIASIGFDPTLYGVTLHDMNAEIHGLCADGRMLRGLEVMRLAYDAADLGWVMRPTGWAPLRPLFDAGYRAFARHRHTISRTAAPLVRVIRAHRARRSIERMHDCRSGACGVPSNNRRPS